MGDTFKAKIEFAVADDEAVWQTTEYLASYIASRLASLEGRTSGPGFELISDDQSSITRDTISELRAAAQEHHLNPMILWVHFDHKRGADQLPPGADAVQRAEFEADLKVFPDLVVRIYSTFRSHWTKRVKVHVDLEAEDRILLDGMKARITAERDHMAARDEAVSGPSSKKSTDVKASESTRPKPDETWSQWLRRTWRDHTAVFVMTVTGTLLAAGLAVWLGLTQ